MSNTVIHVENLSKEYRLGTIGHGTLKQDIQSWWARMHGKEDPNTRIDASTSEQSNNKNGRFCALKDVSFDVEQGEVLGIIGRNGAGKSTLLKILSRITAPTTGIIKIKGRIASLLEVGTGFHPELTGRENIYLNGTILGMKKREIEAKFDEIVKFAEVEKFIDTPVKRYSSGMYVRLAFAVAAHLEPEILIIDEVLAVGDAAFQKKCLGKMRDVSSKEGKTVLFVSHNMAAIAQLCQKCILLEKGRILGIDDTKKTISSYLSNQYEESNGNIDLTKPAMHKNSLENSLFKWTNATVVNSKGKITTSIGLKEPFDLLITGVLKESVDDLMVGFGVMSEMGYPLFNSHLTDTELSQSYPHGEITFKVRFDPNIFGPGSYMIDLGAKGNGIVDWIPEAVRINIEHISIENTCSIRSNYGGVVIYPCNWSLEKIIKDKEEKRNDTYKKIIKKGI